VAALDSGISKRLPDGREGLKALASIDYRSGGLQGATSLGFCIPPHQRQSADHQNRYEPEPHRILP